MCDTGKLYRDASVLEMRKKQVNRLQLERQALEEANDRVNQVMTDMHAEIRQLRTALKDCIQHVPAYVEERYRDLLE